MDVAVDVKVDRRNAFEMVLRADRSHVAGMSVFDGPACYFVTAMGWAIPPCNVRNPPRCHQQ
jgi:hypothetical protein